MGQGTVHKHIVYVVSDATGATGRRVVEAALAQFSGAEVTVDQVPGVREVRDIEQLIQKAAQVGGTIVHTLVVPELRQAMLAEGRRRHVVTIDLIGPLVARLSETLELSPMARPGLLRQLDESYFERIGAIDFAVRHDDGRNPDDLSQADLVLVGVSRTSKTPISIFLAYRGWRVANVPLIVDLEPPPALFQVDRRRVIALTIESSRLVKLRQVRQARMVRGVSLNYASVEHIQQELDWADLILRRERWPVVDVTNKSIEECAAEVIDLQGRRIGEAG
jgi:[pyruvate, water dikinase]-phosphate phosphotransferase / [pyruvate, water dikinase] kinase